MRIQDYPPKMCLSYLWSTIDRYKAARERWEEFKGIRTTVYLSIDGARMVFAAGQWLKRYDTWSAESKGKIGVYPADTSLSFCARFMSDLAAGIDKDDPVIVLTEREMRILIDAATHLDHYSMMLSFEKRKKK